MKHDLEALEDHMCNRSQLGATFPPAADVPLVHHENSSEGLYLTSDLG